ncbi:unnamed protein product [Oikopleura dioica]|uniref:Uncharacterized protein n=1 Tax=Oikopleura dioica TaxID=34765 RepID=E4XRY3_OIKDI|nr:unnamed protein product [Oikopleura dioica]
MKDNGKLAPGVFRNVLSHGLAMAVLPLIAFFLVRAIGFSGITAAVVAVILVHVCLVKFVLSAMKEDTSGGAGGFEKVAEKHD